MPRIQADRRIVPTAYTYDSDPYSNVLPFSGLRALIHQFAAPVFAAPVSGRVKMGFVIMTQWTSKLQFASLAIGVLAGSASLAAAAPREAGIWYDDSGKGAVKVSVCGDKLCGHIYWLKEPNYPDGKPLRDRLNPNQGQRMRSICGLQVIGGLAHMESGEWDSGWIYDPKEGKSYSVAVAMADANTLKVTGYLVMKMMGRTLTWTRAPDDLPSCAQNAAAPAPAKAANTKSQAATQVPAKKASDNANAQGAAASPKKSASKPVASSGSGEGSKKATTATKSGTKAAAANGSKEVLPWAEK